MAAARKILIARPESEARIRALAQRLLLEAGALGRLPTPLEDLFEIARVHNIAELPAEGFLRKLSRRAQETFRSAQQKIRGIADLRERVTYVPRQRYEPRDRFVRGHELGHQVIPWHRIDPSYLDTDETLRPEATDTFEFEANFFSADVIFQGPQFRQRSRDYRPTPDAIFTLASDHVASRQATAWRFVEESDEAIALIQYYPHGCVDIGVPNFRLWQSVASPKFTSKYAGIQLPQILQSGDPWSAARMTDTNCEGETPLPVDGRLVRFEWHSWWNSHALLVLLRRKPLFNVIGSLVRN